ncbi:hypothetical protein ABH926_005967 [Catenulispora sp. GP43]|uniref:hypothetical protein n=1 Tax=Catenulispora sp. GP43 TaxID=3156263 RepID=UPI00351463E0
MGAEHDMAAVAAATVASPWRQGAFTDSASRITAALAAALDARDAHRSNFDGADDEVVRLPGEAVLELIRQLVDKVTDNVKQIMPLNTSYADLAETFYRHRSKFRLPAADSATEFTQVVSETLAGLGRKMERLYLVPPGGPRSEAVRDRLSADLEGGVTSRSLWISKIDSDAPDLASQTPVCPVWIVDGAAVVFQEATEEGASVWKVSARTDDVERVQSLFKELWKRAAQPESAVEDEIDLRDPLLVSAEQMAGNAAMLCTVGNGDQPCGWYHGAWPYLRLFDMVSTPQWHHKFYHDQILDQVLDAPRQLRREAPRVLITGAADYSMLAYVLDAAQRAADMGVERPTVDVLDLCPTPLMMCRWYAGLNKERIQVHETDFCDSGQVGALREATGGYDVIVTDAFLTRFSEEKVASVVRNWYDLLLPGGTVVTTVRLHELDKADPARPGGDLAAAFTQQARHSARRWRPYLQASVDEIAANAYEYACRITSTDLGDESEVCGLLERERFGILSSAVKDVRGELQGTGYLQIVAQKQCEAAK